MTVYLTKYANRYNTISEPGCYRWQVGSPSVFDLSWVRGVETLKTSGKGPRSRVRFRVPTEDMTRRPFSNRTERHRAVDFYKPIDHVPWEIHEIEDETAYASALCAYLKSTEITIGVESGVLDWPPFKLISECSGSARKKLPKSLTLPHRAVLRFPTGEHMKYEIVAWER